MDALRWLFHDIVTTLFIDLAESMNTMEEERTKEVMSYRKSLSNDLNVFTCSISTMTELEFLLFVLLAFFGHIDLSYVGATNERCAPMICQSGQPSIRFPFILKGVQNESCAYPGFELSCNGNGSTVIKLPLSGEFFVDFVHYRQQIIWLKDPKDCLPRRLLKFNASGSTLRAAHYRNFTFWNCSADLEQTLPGLSRVGCLSGKGYDVMVLPTDELFGLDPKSVRGCPDPWTIQVPSVPKDWSSSRTIETIGLTWHEPNCGSCEERHGTCGLKNEKSRVVLCSYPDEKKDPPKRSKWGMIIGMMTPWILLMVVSCYISKKSKARDHHTALTTSASTEQGQRGQVTNPAIIGMDSPSSTLGVDSPTIASYPKIQITENTTKLLEPMGDDTCAICLLEYRTNDTVKIIPECNHHFHDHCIDQWLRKKATCPLCRKKQHRHQLQYE